jgi:hypothetical protein
MPMLPNLGSALHSQSMHSFFVHAFDGLNRDRDRDSCARGSVGCRVVDGRRGRLSFGGLCGP